MGGDDADGGGDDAPPSAPAGDGSLGIGGLRGFPSL